jgi:hypothetical protein
MFAYPVFTSKRFWAIIGILTVAIWFNRQKSLTFSVERISSTLTPRAEWAVTLSDKERGAIRPILGQTYRYLASGTQSYAFLSDDGKYVLKFFRMKHLLPSLGDYVKGRVERRRSNLAAIFAAHKLAYEALREESGLVFIHLNKTDDLNTQMAIVDRLGRRHLIDLDKFEFVVQERAELLFSRLRRIDRDKARQEADAVLSLVRRRIAKGFADQDKAVSHNYGFVGDRPIQIDIGRVFQGSKPGEYERIEKRIARWFDENPSS